MLPSMMARRRPDYFFAALSFRSHLDKCRELSLAGFPTSSTGSWAFVDIAVGDRLSFIFGARAIDLFEVVGKAAVALGTADNPWAGLEKQVDPAKETYPFRLRLRRLRKFDLGIAQKEFAYIANNLMRRGGYRKSHFQADQSTLSFVATVGEPCHDEVIDTSSYWGASIETRFFRRKGFSYPLTAPLNEQIIQAAIRRRLSESKPALDGLWQMAWGNSEAPENPEILGEVALDRGFPDLEVKPALKVGGEKRFLIEVKMHPAGAAELDQIADYKVELGNDWGGGALLAPGFRDGLLSSAKVRGVALVKWDCRGLNLREPQSFDSIVKAMSFEAQ